MVINQPYVLFKNNEPKTLIYSKLILLIAKLKFATVLFWFLTFSVTDRIIFNVLGIGEGGEKGAYSYFLNVFCFILCQS